MLKKRLSILKIFISVIIILLCRDLYAIGEISFGANIGLTRDPNNLESDVNAYNASMAYHDETIAGTQSSQIPQSYCFVWGFNFRYQFNFLLFRLGSHFCQSGQKYKGSLQTADGEVNKIKITTYQSSTPFSIAFIVPLKEKTYFYLGGGLSYNQAYVKITQSNPEATNGLLPDSNRRNRYTEDFPGYHLIIGAEAPIPSVERFTISVEWIHQEGRSFPLSNGGLDESGNTTYTPKKTISIEGDFILLGVNYYIPF